MSTVLTEDNKTTEDIDLAKNSLFESPKTTENSDKNVKTSKNAADQQCTCYWYRY